MLANWQLHAFKLMRRAAGRTFVLLIQPRELLGCMRLPVRRRQKLRVEQLEQREMLSIAASLIDSHDALFTGVLTDTLYLRTGSGAVQWSSDNVHYTTTGIAGFTFSATGSVSVQGIGNTFLETISGAAGTFQDTGPLTIDTNASVTAQGQALTFAAPSVTLSAGAQISTNQNVTITASDSETGLTAAGNAQ